MEDPTVWTFFFLALIVRLEDIFERSGPLYLMRIVFPLAILLGFLLLQGQAAPQSTSLPKRTAMDLDQYQWKNRLLLIFAPSESSADYRSQLQFLKAQQSQLVDRNLLLIRVFKETGFVGDQAINSEAIAQLRKRYGIQSDEFRIILVGKDGTEKRRETAPTAMNAIYRQIDQMPMRRQEMSDRAN
ncbi:DUF4174 domain-containing protein [Phormidesmis sp. 146-35]